MRRIFITLILVFVCTTCEKSDKKTVEALIEFNTPVRFFQKPSQSCFKFNFHYLEIENVLYTSVVRHIEIFLDEKAFSEENLKTLFAYLSEKNPEPQHLTVIVHTNWAQLDCPSDCPGTGRSGVPERQDKYDYYQATYYRREKVEYFSYNPILKVREAKFKTVVIRGKEKSSDK